MCLSTFYFVPERYIELYNFKIYAEVVTRVASSLEAVGLPAYPEVLFVVA